jgi:general L-amino acid transport system substrate-binding protein
VLLASLALCGCRQRKTNHIFDSKDEFTNVAFCFICRSLQSKTLEALIPRSGKNELNRGNNGLMYSFPFGSLHTVVGPDIEEASPTIRAIRQRGFLNCGINSRYGFATFDSPSKTWSGFDVDLCRAISAAIFQGVDQLVVYTDLPAAQRFQLLREGRVDVLARLTTWTMERDVLEPTAATATGSGGRGFTFSTPYFYDNVAFAGIPNYVACAERRDVASPECQDLKFCVVQSSTAHLIVDQLFHKRYYTAKLEYDDIIDALNAGSCNVIAGGSFDVAVATVQHGGYFGEYQVGNFLNETITGELDHPLSKDPLSIVTRQDDVAWSDFCQWIFWSLIYAEEQNITQATAMEMPVVTLFGPLRTETFFHAVNAVGNYGELYQRNFASIVNRGGLNDLNDQDGPQMFTIPGINVNTATNG